jgi:hypothetical protein
MNVFILSSFLGVLFTFIMIFCFLQNNFSKFQKIIIFSTQDDFLNEIMLSEVEVVLTIVQANKLMWNF